MDETLVTLLYVVLALVLAVLVTGVYAMLRGGEFGHTWSNRLMRARVFFQFVAIVLVVLVFWVRGAFAG